MQHLVNDSLKLKEQARGYLALTRDPTQTCAKPRFVLIYCLRRAPGWRWLFSLFSCRSAARSSWITLSVSVPRNL